MFVWLALARGLGWSAGRLLGLAVVLTIGIGVALGSLEAAARTDNPYPSYLRRAEVGELVVNPGTHHRTGGGHHRLEARREALRERLDPGGHS